MIIEKEGEHLTVEQLEKLTGSQWMPKLKFNSPRITLRVQKKILKLQKRGQLSIQQLWMGKYFQKEIETSQIPDVAIRWINVTLGWGVFALRDFKELEFIAEYAGVVRRRKWRDKKNPYCFEYNVSPDHATPYTVDALEQGALARFINHSDKPNLKCCLATFNNEGHILFYTGQPIAKGTQLCYDYGPNYWTKRKPPLAL